MDQIVAQALTVYGKIAGMKRKEAAVSNGNGNSNGNGKISTKIQVTGNAVMVK
jgi:hypothetical protein